MHLRSKTVQQLLSVILSVVMVLSMLPMEVLAQETPPVTTPMDLTAITEDTSGDGWSWTQSTKTLTLTGLTLTVSDDSTHALILPDGATIDLADGTASTLTGGSRSTVYSSGEVKLRGSGSLTVYGRGWRSATLDMFIPGTLTVEYDNPDGGAVLKTDEGTEGAAICANVTLDNGILRATGPDFASADDGSSVGLRGRLTTHGSSVEAQLTARTGYASYGLYFDKQGSGRGDTWTMGLGKVTAAAGHALSRYSYGLYVDYSSVNALELDGTQLTAMGGESDQYGSQGVFAGEEVIVKNGATVTATGGQVNSSYESVGFNAVSWLTVSGENSRVLGYGGTSVKGDSKGIRCDSRFTLTDGCVFGQGGVSCTSSRNVGVEFKRLIMESGKLEGISGSPDSSYQTWGGQFNAYGLYCTGTAKITGGELIGTANGTDRELDYSAYGFYGSDELTMSGGTLRATTGDTPNASSGTLAALSVVSNKSKTQLSGGTIYARAGVSNDDRSYGMRILGTGSTLTMTNTEDAAQPLSLYVTGRNTALSLADGGLLPEITASSAYDAEADTLTDGYTFSNKQYRKDGTAALSLSAAACLHSASDDTGLCTKCGKRVYEAVLLTDGAVTQRYAAAGEAFTAAQTEEHQGCTLRLLTDLIDDGQPLVHDPVVTITGGRFTLDLHNHTIAGKTSDDREGVVTVTGGQLRIENGTLENLCTGNGSKAQALTLLGTDTHVTLANVTAIGATPPNGDTSASVYAPDGARLTIESGEFTGRVAGTYASAPTETPHVSIAGGTFHNGLSYSIHETEANAATLLAILKEGYALAHADGTPVDLGTEPSFSRFSGTYTLSGEVQVVAHTHNVRSGRPGCCGCGYACPHDGQMPDSYFTLPVCSLCGVSYGTPLKDLRTPTGKIIIDENNWWQDFLNTVTFGLFFPTGARFTIEAADDSVDHAGYDPELYPVTVEYLVTDQRYTSDKIGDLAHQFRPYPGKAVALPDDQTSIVYAKITDWAGNVTYLSTDDLTVDATAPEISSDVAENQIYCEDGLRIAFRDDHLKSVTLNGTEMTYAAEDGWYVLRLSAVSGSQEGQQTLTVTDEAGNGTTVHFQWYAGHGFDDTGLCSHCGLQAEARWNDAFFPHLEDALTSADADEDGARFTPVVMLTNVSLPADAFSLDGIRAVLALEGHTLTLSAPMTLEQSSGDLTIRDSTSSGKITGQALTVKGGRLTVEAGCFENTLNLQAYNVTLFGGTFARITSEDAAYPRAALPFRTAYQQADGQLIRRSDITPTLENVAVVSCPHDEIDGITCRICGTKMVAKVAKDDTLRYFAVFEDAAQYAAALEGSAITLLRDALWGSMGLPTGTYTLDLNGKTLSGSNDLMIDASLTICDSQGGGKLWRDGTILVLGGHVAITGGQFNRVYLASDSADLSVTGGTFARIAYSGEDTSRTPLFFPAEGYTFQKADGNYANTGDVVTEENLRYLEDVTVTTPPFTITRYPVDTDLYPTTPVGYRPDFVTEVTFHIPESSPTIEFQWYQVGDPDRIKSYGSAVAWQNPFTLYTFIDGPAQYYGIFSYKGYSVRTDVLTVRELTCDHPGVDADNRCSQCRAEVAASVELNGSTGYYLSLSEALALARTDAYRGCTLTVLRSSTDPISVNSGSFTLTAAQGVMLGGKVTLAKDATVTLSGGSYTNSASIFGSNRIEGGTFYGAVALQDGSSVSSGSFLGAVTISDTVTVTGGTFTGDVTIDNGGKLVASAGTFGSVNVQSGGGGALTGGHFGEITQIDGSPCAALLAEGCAYSDGGIINGYVPIVGGVDVVPHAQHQYVWLNQKLLCGCGHVADEDADAPVITSLGTGALTVEYRAQGGEFTAQAPKAVGSYTVRVTAAADDDYASASAQRNFRITAKRVTIDGVTVEPSKTYDGTTDATIVTGGTLSANFDGNDLRIVTGSAAYDGKNVGTGKTVSFSGFSLEGDAAENYTLASQPAGTTADITVRTVTVEDLHIQDKLYDGTDRAEYDGEPTLGNAVSGDHVALVNGTPSFTSIRTAEDIAIRFTEFSLTGADAGNYALTQPTGITASILPYALTGGEYAVNSNDWINHDFVVTAAEGYLLSLTDTADGVWQQTLRATDETAEGRLTFYVKDLATGVISLQVTEQYRIDRTQPTGEIRVDERTAWQSFLSRITFGLFYREEQTVVITSADETSGVAATEYLLSAEDLDIPALEQETFLPYEKALALAPDGEYVVYARITDRAGNVTCLRSDGMVLDATAPAITGAENGGVYCAAVTLTITDAYPVTVTVNGTPVELTEGRLVLRPAEGTQLVTATDPAGNESRLEITVNDGHTWGDWSSNGDDTHTRTCTISGCGALETESCTGGEATCVDRAVCEVCGGAYGDVDAHRHADLRHVEAKAATTEAPGNIEYWYCAACGKYFADAQACRELRQTDTVTEKLPAAPTGDEAPLTLWVIVLAACAGLALLLLVLRRRNSHRTA